MAVRGRRPDDLGHGVGEETVAALPVTEFLLHLGAHDVFGEQGVVGGREFPGARTHALLQGIVGLAEGLLGELALGEVAEDQGELAPAVAGGLLADGRLQREGAAILAAAPHVAAIAEGRGRIARVVSQQEGDPASKHFLGGIAKHPRGGPVV